MYSNYLIYNFFLTILPLLINVYFLRIVTETNSTDMQFRMVKSTPGSPQDRRPVSFEVIGSAESLVGRVCV